MCSKSFNIISATCFVHNEESWDGYGCEECNNTYNQGKTLIMVVNIIPFPTYCPNLDERQRIYMQQV
jgi:hypothetical protein